MRSESRRPRVRQCLASCLGAFVSCLLLAGTSISSFGQLATGQATPAPEVGLWITLGSDAVAALRESREADDWAHWLETHETHQGVTIALLRPEQLDSLARVMHQRFNRCGGFIVHPSRAAALDHLYRDPGFVEANLVTYTIDNGAVAQALIAEVAATNVVSTINMLAANTTRYYTNSGGVNAANQLKALWESYAAGRTDVTVQLFTHAGWAQPSVIATITGTTLPSEVVVIGGHLDSINSSSPASGTAPGADDDASGVASLGETFRAAMALGYRPHRTVKFMAYAAEEVGLRGSGEIATAHKNQGIDVVGVLQLDMTNYKGTPTSDIVFITDNTNAAQTAFLGDLVDTYLPTLVRSSSACGYACSDHASWTNQGFVASFPFEAAMGQHNSNIHKTTDTLANSDPTGGHAIKFSRLAAAYVAELAKGGFGTGGDTTPPTATVTAPTSGATVAGTTTISCAATDDVAVTRVDFLVDGSAIGNDTSSPYDFAWATGTATNGSHTVACDAFDAGGNRGSSAAVTVTVANTNGGAQSAVYDSVRRAPKCATVGISCDSGATLLRGRGTRGPEPNRPNTINGSCNDGNGGTFHVDESNDRIKVSTVDGGNFAAGKQVRIEATVWAFSTFTSDRLDLYRAANAVSPSWVFVATLSPTTAGAQTLSATYTLPTGSLQAVRARFRYQGSAAACATGSYIDHDDLIFAVQ